MGFQTGTQIRPELANADYSGFANAASIRAQALANLGQEIGEGIQKYQKNKEITAVSLAQLEALGAANPDAIAAVKSAGGDVAKSFSNIEKGDYKQRDVLASLGAMQAYVTEQDRQRQAQAQEQEYQIKAAQLEELSRSVQTGREVTPEEFAALSTTSTVQATPLPSGNYLVKEVTAKPLTGTSAPKGKTVTMEEVEDLRNQGYDPTVEFGPDGQPRLTKMSPFSPRGEESDAFQEAAQKKAGESFGTSITEWQSGGSLQARKNLRSINNAFEALASGAAETRTFVDFVPDIGGFRDSARAFLNPTGQDAYDNVVAVVATTLKDALGHQFTEKEGTRILNASYNPQLSTEQNLQRLAGIAAVISATIEAKDAQAEAFMEGGDWRSLPSPKEIFETNLAIYENSLQDTDRSIGIPPTGSNAPIARIKSIRTRN